MNFQLTCFVVLHIVFDLNVKLADQTRKFELYKKELNSTIKGLNEKIESLHHDMDMLLQSQQKFLAGMEQIKEEAAERKKIIINMASTVAHYENKTKWCDALKKKMKI